MAATILISKKQSGRRRLIHRSLGAIAVGALALATAPVASATVADDYYACKKEQGAGSGMLCCITIKNSRGDWGTPIMSGRKYVGCKWSSELSPQSQGITVNDPEPVAPVEPPPMAPR